MLKRILTNPSATPTLDEFIAPRRKDKAITREISEMLVKTFVTTLEREDIEALSNALSRFPRPFRSSPSAISCAARACVT